MNIKNWLWTQKEGILIGGAWGILAPFAGLGMAVLENNPFWYKLLILPTYLASFAGLTPVKSFVLSVCIGVVLGAVIDLLYKPDE